MAAGRVGARIIGAVVIEGDQIAGGVEHRQHGVGADIIIVILEIAGIAGVVDVEIDGGADVQRQGVEIDVVGVVGIDEAPHAEGLAGGAGQDAEGLGRLHGVVDARLVGALGINLKTVPRLRITAATAAVADQGIVAEAAFQDVVVVVAGDGIVATAADGVFEAVDAVVTDLAAAGGSVGKGDIDAVRGVLEGNRIVGVVPHPLGREHCGVGDGLGVGGGGGGVEDGLGGGGKICEGRVICVLGDGEVTDDGFGIRCVGGGLVGRGDRQGRGRRHGGRGRSEGHRGAGHGASGGACRGAGVGGGAFGGGYRVEGIFDGGLRRVDRCRIGGIGGLCGVEGRLGGGPGIARVDRRGFDGVADTGDPGFRPGGLSDNGAGVAVPGFVEDQGARRAVHGPVTGEAGFVSSKRLAHLGADLTRAKRHVPEAHLGHVALKAFESVVGLTQVEIARRREIGAGRRRSAGNTVDEHDRLTAVIGQGDVMPVAVGDRERTGGRKGRLG